VNRVRDKGLAASNDPQKEFDEGKPDVHEHPNPRNQTHLLIGNRIRHLSSFT
jgi:hypothetical protein